MGSIFFGWLIYKSASFSGVDWVWDSIIINTLWMKSTKFNSSLMVLGRFDVHEDTIIRTEESRSIGAKFLDNSDVFSREECLRLCCETDGCDVFVFEEKVKKKLFEMCKKLYAEKLNRSLNVFENKNKNFKDWLKRLKLKQDFFIHVRESSIRNQFFKKGTAKFYNIHVPPFLLTPRRRRSNETVVVMYLIRVGVVSNK